MPYHAAARAAVDTELGRYVHRHPVYLAMVNDKRLRTLYISNLPTKKAVARQELINAIRPFAEALHASPNLYRRGCTGSLRDCVVCMAAELSIPIHALPVEPSLRTGLAK
eukprot:1685583-Amphidinium_carterae.1